MTPRRNTLLVITSTAFVLIGVLLLVKAPDAGAVRMALMMISFFGGCAIVGAAQAIERTGSRRLNARRSVDQSRAVFAVRRGHYAVLAAAAAFMAFGSGVALGAPDAPHALLWAGAALFGVAAGILAVWSLDRTKIVIDAEGVFDTRLTRAPLAWSRIARLSHVSDWRRVEMIEIELDDAAFAEALGPRDRKVRAPRPLRLSPITLDGAIDDIVHAARRFAPNPALVCPAAAPIRDRDDANGRDADTR